MRRTVHYKAAGVGIQSVESLAPSSNHFTGKLSKEASAQVEEMGMVRVAGNIYEVPSTKDFWKVSENGGLVRLTGGEVDNGEKMAPAPKESSQVADFLQGILADLDF